VAWRVARCVNYDYYYNYYRRKTVVVVCLRVVTRTPKVPRSSNRRSHHHHHHHYGITASHSINSYRHDKVVCALVGWFWCPRRTNKQAKAVVSVCTNWRSWWSSLFFSFLLIIQRIK
jgi:hypothetical protein